MNAHRVILAGMVCVAAALTSAGCASHKSDDVLVRERLAQFDRAWTEHDPSGVRQSMASATPEERDLATALASLATSKKQLLTAERRAIAQIEKSIPFPLRMVLGSGGAASLGIKPGALSISRWDALAKEAGSPKEVTIGEDGQASVTTASERVTFYLRRQDKRWVIDPQTFGKGGAATAAAAMRREAEGDAQIATALSAKSADQLTEALPRVLAQRVSDMALMDVGEGGDGGAASLIEQILRAQPAAAQE